MSIPIIVDLSDGSYAFRDNLILARASDKEVGEEDSLPEVLLIIVTRIVQLT